MAQAKNFFMEIVTPEGKVFSGNAEAAVVPGVEGEIGILADHAALLSEISLGELRVTSAGKTQIYAVESGVVEIRDNAVSVAVESAQKPDEIDRQNVKLIKDRAEAAIRENREPALVAKAQNDLKVALLLEKISVDAAGKK